MIHERQLFSATMWDLRASFENALRVLGLAQRAVDAWRANPTAEQRHEALTIVRDQLHQLGTDNGEVTRLLVKLQSATEEMLRIVPMDLREASYALGVPKWKTIVRIVIPTALSGIVTGIMLALARVMGETAPLLILVGYAQAMNFDMFSGFMGSLPGMMYDQISAGAGANPVPTDRLWGAALTLILLIAVLNIGARAVAKLFSPKKV